jgi:hypothetical protein
MRTDLLMFRVTTGILALWGLWALVDVMLDNFVSARSFGLVSPVIGFACLLLSLGALIRAFQLGLPKRYAIAAVLLGLVIGVVPFAALPFDPS